MRNNNVMALIFSNMHDESMRDMTAVRSMGSIPIGGRYRLIDFPLSGLVNTGITKVGIVTKSRYQSLMDHIGSGKSWDLSRKNDGLTFLPPFNESREELYGGRVATLAGLGAFLTQSKEEYVLMTDCNVVGNIDYGRLIEAHIESGADITMGYKRGMLPDLQDNILLTLDDDGWVTDMQTNAVSATECCYGLGIYILRRELLWQLVTEAVAHNQMFFDRDILQRNHTDLRVLGAEITEYTTVVCSLSSYYAANMAFLNDWVRQSLFLSGRPIYTKVRDCAPATYGLHSEVSDSLVADGAHIEGTVRNSIIFRNVHIERGAVVENSIVMQGSVVKQGAMIHAVILDKNVTVQSGRTLRGAYSYPMFIHKDAVV